MTYNVLRRDLGGIWGGSGFSASRGCSACGAAIPITFTASTRRRARRRGHSAYADGPGLIDFRSAQVISLTISVA
jgi:hypothetical protein